ncbi:MAG TPA: gliding motility-associated C-terminal domain-containing protein [Chitinophagaceae bacterium]|nr:gliding motility-associated C-terminal domain-containing protein [Chitinophagaceae bacterium]
MKRFLCIVYLFPVFSFVNAQFLSNPSLEGPIGPNLIPPGWQPCKAYSTPDTQPGAWNCTTQSSEGSSYTNLISRGDNQTASANSTEDIGTALLKPLLKNNCYFLSIDLALSNELGSYDSWGEAWIPYNKPVVLKIWGGYGNCEKTELLWVSNPIENTSWKTYNVILFSSNIDINYLTLEADYVSLPEYFGNVLIDKLKITEQNGLHISKLDTTVIANQPFQLNASTGSNYNWTPAEGLSCTDCQNPNASAGENIVYEVTVSDNNGCSFIEEFIINVEILIPNVFTPNRDGMNDAFEIRGLPSDWILQVFNRWGQKVFSQENYSNDWYGVTNQKKDLPEGVYYYVLASPDLKRHFNGSITLIR